MRSKNISIIAFLLFVLITVDAAKVKHRLRRQLANDTITIEKGSVLLLSASLNKPCDGKNADYIFAALHKSKVDFVAQQQQNFTYYISTTQDSTTPGPWNKIALIDNVLKVSKSEWIIWMDHDTLIVGPNFRFPLEKYDGYDFVSWGDWDQVKNGDVIYGMNSGVMLIRNTNWSRELFGEMLKLGRSPDIFNFTFYAEHGIKYTSGIHDQGGFVFMFKNYESKYRPKVFFQNTIMLRMNQNWKTNSVATMLKDNNTNIVKHWYGCKFCNVPVKDYEENDMNCRQDALETIALSQKLWSNYVGF